MHAAPVGPPTEALLEILLLPAVLDKAQPAVSSTVQDMTTHQPDISSSTHTCKHVHCKHMHVRKHTYTAFAHLQES